MKELKLRAWHKTEKKMYDVLSIDWQTGNISLSYDNQSDWEVTREKETLFSERIENVDISVIAFEKDGKKYKLYIPTMGEPRLIEVEE